MQKMKLAAVDSPKGGIHALKAAPATPAEVKMMCLVSS